MPTYLWYTVWLILPLLPSILLFKALPTNSATVKTVTQGLEIKLSGSVAIYALIVYFCSPFKLGIVNPEKNWTLIAGFSDRHHKSVPFSQIKGVDAIPPLDFHQLGGNKALLHIPGVTVNNGELVLPYYIQIAFKDFESIIIASDSLRNSKRCSIDWYQETITLSNLEPLDAKIHPAQDSVTVQTAVAKEQLISN